jgi:hypothetical protein
MSSPLFDLSARLGLAGGAETLSTLKGVEDQAKLTDAAMAGFAKTVGVDLATAMKLGSQMTAENIAILNQQYAPIQRVAAVSYEADRAFQGMARSSLFVASTGNLAGRGMAGFIANISRLIGPGSILLSALAIGGLAVDTFFNRFEKGEEKAEKAAKKAIDAILNPLTEKDEEKRRLELFHERADVLDKIAKTQERLDYSEKGGPMAVPILTLKAQLVDLKSQLDNINVNIADATRIADALSAQKAAREDTERAMADARSEIEQRAQEYQAQTDEGHLAAAKKALGFQQDAQALLAKTEASYRSMGVSADQIKKNIVDADAEMNRRLGRGGRTEQVIGAARGDKQNAKDAKDNPALDAIEAETDALIIQRQRLEQTGQQWTVAQAAVLKFADIQQRLNELMETGALDTEAMKRALGDQKTAMDEMATAGETLDQHFMGAPAGGAGPTLGDRIKTALTPDWTSIKQNWVQSLAEFGRTVGQGILNVFSNMAQGGQAAKSAFANLGKTILGGLGNLISSFGAALVPFGELMNAFKAAMMADPVFGGAVAIGVGVALMALGATLGGIVAGGGASTSAGSFSTNLGASSTITTLYGNPGTTNPLTGLPSPTGPQQPIVVNATIVGANDTNAGKQLVALLNATARTGPGGQLRSYAVQGG